MPDHQLLHLVIGGELQGRRRHEFRDLAKVDFVGAYPNYAEAFVAWKAQAQATVDNALMRYFIIHAHRLLDPHEDGHEDHHHQRHMSALNALCDAGAARARPDAGAAAHPRLVLAATILASSLAFIDGSVVNVGLPAIGQSLRAGAGDLPWVINAYLLPLSALLLFGGAAGDRFGRRRLLIAGTAAVRPGLGRLRRWRRTWRCCSPAAALQGVGAAMLMPNSLAILGDAFSGEARGRAIGIWAAVGAVAGAIGPVLGGWLIDTVGWRAIFLINLPLAAGAIVLAWLFVARAAGRPAAAAGLPARCWPPLGLGALTWGLTLGSGQGGWTATALAWLAGGAGAARGVRRGRARRGDASDDAAGDVRLQNFVGLTLLTLLLYGALARCWCWCPIC